MRKKSSKTNIDPRKIFEHAERFQWTDDHLRRHRDMRIYPLILFPTMVLSVFASELYLKCLDCIDRGEVTEEHSLQKLYQSLPELRQKRIEALWNEMMQAQKSLLDKRDREMNAEIPRDLTRALKDCDRAFVQLRYVYEDSQFKFYMPDFPIVLRKAILEIQPSWLTDLPDPAVGIA